MVGKVGSRSSRSLNIFDEAAAGLAVAPFYASGLQAGCASFFAAPAAAATRVMVLKLKQTLAAPSSAPHHRVMRRAAPPQARIDIEVVRDPQHRSTACSVS